MSRMVSLFPRYSQKENRTTNYCLLVLRMLYEENPKLLGETLSSLIDPEIGDKVGVVFRQQEKAGASVLDGVILQEPIAIYIETKNFDWFYDKQLSNHLEALGKASGVKVLLALSNFEDKGEARFAHIQQLCAEKYKETIIFKAATFQEFVDSIETEHLSKNLTDTITEFRDYLDAENLLPTWKKLLDVVNCAGRPNEITHDNVYFCPATGGAYNHARCKYFGMYRNKRVEHIAIIRAVIDVEGPEQTTVKWINVDEPSESLSKDAIDKVKKLRPSEYPKRVFLLEEGSATNFIKDTSGGMYTSKQYFNIERMGAGDSKDLANKLDGKTWSELRSQIAF